MKPVGRALLAFVVSLVRSPASLGRRLRLGLHRPELRMDEGERPTPLCRCRRSGNLSPGS